MSFVDVLISTKDDLKVGPSGQVGSNRSVQESHQVAPSSAAKRARSSGVRGPNFKLADSTLQIASQNAWNVDLD